MKTYSFLSFNGTIVGPGGIINVGNGAGPSEEGITFDPVGDKNTMSIGVDGQGMHSLHADKSGTITMHFLRTSPVNAQLQAMYDLQSLDPSLWGQMVITGTDSASGDSTGCRGVAFKRKTRVQYSKDGGTREWLFDAIAIDTIFGS